MKERPALLVAPPPGRQCARPAAASSLRWNFFWSLAGNIVFAGSQWATLSLLAKLTTPSDVGLYSLGLAVTAPIILLANLNLRAVQSTDVRESFSFGHYATLRLATTGLALLAIAAATYGLAYPRLARGVILSVGIAKAIEALSDVTYGRFQQRERMWRIAGSLVLRGVLSVGAVGLVLRAYASVLWASVAIAATWLVVLLLHDLPLVREDAGGCGATSSTVSPGRILDLARKAMPLGVVMAVVSLQVNIPRYYLERFRGVEELGYFAALSYVLMAGTLVVNALGQAASPRLAALYLVSDLSAFERLTGRLLLMGVVLGLAGVAVVAAAGGTILTWVYTPEYANRAGAFLWMAIGATVSYVASFLGFAITAAQRFARQVPQFVVCAVATLIAAAQLVPRFGVLGAAWATGIGATVQVAYAAVLYRSAVRRR